LVKTPEAIAYLRNRGLKTETLKEFEVGYVQDGWRNLYNFLSGRGYSAPMMEKSGMVIKKEASNGQFDSYYDRFRNRIMFPVKNLAGQTIGFSGRIFKETGEDQGGKYINNPQTTLYDKSRVLFAFDKAKNEIRKNDLCILVEGQMDVIMSHQAGVKNTVAVSGTALTQEHLNIIKRLTEKLAIAFDKDEAGLRASRRGIDMALVAGFDVNVILIPSGKDPADTIKENPETWREAVKNSKNIINFYIESVSDPQRIKEAILPYVKLIPDEIKKADWIKSISSKFGIKEESIWSELEKIVVELPEQSPTIPVEPQGDHKNRLGFLSDCMVGFINWQKDTGDKDLKEEIEKFRDKIKTPESEREKERQIFEAERHYENSLSLIKEFKNLVREFKKEEIKSQLEDITNQIYKIELLKDNMEGEEKDKKFNELLNKFKDLSKQLNDIQ
jgi:DNA primase